MIGPIPDALESEHAGGAAERVASSRFVRQTVTATMSGDLIDRATEDAVRYAVVQRMGKQVLAEDALDQIVERLLQTPELWMLVDRIADSHPVAQVLERQSDYIAQAIGEQMRKQARQRAEARLERVATHVLRLKERRIGETPVPGANGRLPGQQAQSSSTGQGFNRSG